MHERALPGAAGTHNRDERAFGDVQRDTHQRCNIVVALAIGFANVDAANHSKGGSADEMNARRLNSWSRVAGLFGRKLGKIPLDGLD